MEPGIDIMVVWPMSAMEAKATGWDKIEPFHLLCAALKFAELDPDNLNQLADGGGDRQQVLDAHQRMVEHLSERWTIEIPETSTALRRRLRRSGNGHRIPDGGILHRSHASREAFRRAELAAEAAGRSRFNAVDLIDAIFAQQDGWITRIMNMLNLSCESEGASSLASLPKAWDSILQRIEPHESPDNLEHGAIQFAPAVKVLAGILMQGDTHPCLLISSGDRTSRDVVGDLVTYQKARRSSAFRFLSVDSRRLLQSITSASDPPITELLQWMAEKVNRKSVFFFDSLHRYLSTTMAGERFPRQFRAWLRTTDSRFIFGIPETQYHALIETQAQWKDIFRIIWIYDSPKGQAFEL